MMGKTVACRFSGLIVLFCAFVIMTACTASMPESKPVPELTLEHVKPLPVNIAVVDIENKYNSEVDPNDVSSSFPTPPDIALRRYAENKIEPSGSQGTLKFVIEGAHIHHSLVQPAGKLTSWFGLNSKDLYEVEMRIRMYTLSEGGMQSEHSILNLRRSIAIPQRYSVAEKEHEKLIFLEMLMDDVDKAVTSTLHEKMNLTVL